MGSYKVEIKKSALKDLKKIEKSFIPQIFHKISALSENPRPAQSLKLKGSENNYRLRIGNYRIIYQLFIKSMIQQELLPSLALVTEKKFIVAHETLNLPTNRR